MRYERLLMLAAPISLACILLAFVASASDLGTVKRRSACQLLAAELLEKNQTDLQIQYDKNQRIGGKLYFPEYSSAVSMIMIEPRVYQNCDDDIAKVELNENILPKDLISRLKKQSLETMETFEKSPIRSYGVEIPEKAVISVFGTKIQMGITTSIQVLQVVLVPVLVLWLGSLYNTRYRETLLIDSASQISDLYPHSVNIYAVGFIPSLRKKSWANYYFKMAIPYFPIINRLFVLSIFVFPATISYIFSLYYLSDGFEFSKIGLALLVGTYVLMNLGLETVSWHSGKLFPPSTSVMRALLQR